MVIGNTARVARCGRSPWYATAAGLGRAAARHWRSLARAVVALGAAATVTLAAAPATGFQSVPPLVAVLDERGLPVGGGPALFDGAPLVPGVPAERILVVRNDGGQPATLRVGARPQRDEDLPLWTGAGGLRARVADAGSGEVLYDGLLSSMAAGRPALVLPGQANRISLAVWAPAAGVARPPAVAVTFTFTAEHA